MSQEFSNEPLFGADASQFSIDGDVSDVAAWTEIEAGRFMPRRVRGSFQGRALGGVFTVPSSGSDDAQCQDKPSV